MRKVVVGLPDEVLAGIDDLVSETNGTRSLIIREACHFYIEERRRKRLRDKMKAGYQEMAEINRILAEEMGSDFGELDPCGVPEFRGQSQMGSLTEVSDDSGDERQDSPWRRKV